MNKIIDWFIKNNEYAPMFSAIISGIALITTVITTLITNIISKYDIKRDRELLCKQHMENLRIEKDKFDLENKRRLEEKEMFAEENRLLKRPYFICKKVSFTICNNPEGIIITSEFFNQGNGIAYNVFSDNEANVTPLKFPKFKIQLRDGIPTPIVSIGDKIDIQYFVESKYETQPINVDFQIYFSDLSKNKYKQCFTISIIDSKGNFNILECSEPELLKN